MRIIHSWSPNHALYEGIHHLRFHGITEQSRNGPVIVSADPVMTIHHNPRARVLNGVTRDANPFFHLFEALWMLAGRNDLAFPATFVKRFADYSDDGATLHGAYGHRWRRWFGYDQLETIISELTANPSTRRAVLSMWDGGFEDTTGAEPLNFRKSDLRVGIEGGKDVPCNTHIYFDTLRGALNMTIMCRSNDVIWGAYGANIVHFSVLHEYVALRTGLQLGQMRQYSNNFHIYSAVLPTDDYFEYAGKVVEEDVYTKLIGFNPTGYGKAITRTTEGFLGVPLFGPGETWEEWHEDLNNFVQFVPNWNDVDTDPSSYSTKFFTDVVQPMFEAWAAHKLKNHDHAMRNARHVVAPDWCEAAMTWLSKRRGA